MKSSWKVYTFDFEDLSRIPQLSPPTTTTPRRQSNRSLKLQSSAAPSIKTTTAPTITTSTRSNKEEEDSEGPIFYRGILRIEGDHASPAPDAAGQLHLADTFLATHGLGKGVAWVNGFNLGWYWPTMGPQMTLYVPGPVLVPGDNDILILEVEKVAGEDAVQDSVQVSFVDEPDFYGPNGKGGGGGKSGNGGDLVRGRHWGRGRHAEKAPMSIV